MLKQTDGIIREKEIYSNVGIAVSSLNTVAHETHVNHRERICEEHNGTRKHKQPNEETELEQEKN